MSANFTAANAHQNTTQGWVSSPNGRGTRDILWSSVFTITLCCWTSVFVNVPAVSDSTWQHFRDKLDLACLGLLGPEFLFTLALGQWYSARQSVMVFKKAGYAHWSMRHAFYVDMGAFLLQTPGWPAFPVDGRQLLYLVEKGYLDCPMLARGAIENVDKADGLARYHTYLLPYTLLLPCTLRSRRSITEH